MIELRNDQLQISFPDLHPEAKLKIEFQRTLRIPDDEDDYPLPPGLGRFPIRHIDDYQAELDAETLRRGGVIFPMYQSEAMWLNFASNSIPDRATSYPFAIKIATGKINAVSGGEWTAGLGDEPQNYLVSPEQPWLDGYCVEKDLVRQFVAVPLGTGHSAEEQITGRAEHGGLQIEVFPMKRDVFDRRFPEQVFHVMESRAPATAELCAPRAVYCKKAMALAPGGKMRQQIHEDPYDLEDWDMDHSSRCFVHIANTMIWKAITGSEPPLPPPTASEYTMAGLPWFDHYSDAPAIAGSKDLANLKSVRQFDETNGSQMLPENDSVKPKRIVPLRKGLRKHEVRSGIL